MAGKYLVLRGINYGKDGVNRAEAGDVVTNLTLKQAKSLLDLETPAIKKVD